MSASQTHTPPADAGQPSAAAGDATAPSDPPVVAAEPDGEVALPVCWLAVFEPIVIGPAIAMLTVNGIVLALMPQPRDVQLVAELLAVFPFGWWAIWAAVMFTLRFVGARGVIWRASGIRLAGQPTRLPWSQVTAIDVRWRALRGRTVVIARRNGPDVPMGQPLGAGWLPDPRFDRAVAALRAWAAAHGGNPAPTGRYRTGPPRPAAVVAAAVGAVLVVAVTTLWRGVIWPWEPTAVQVPDLCPTLPAAMAGEGWTGPDRRLDAAGGRLWCAWILDTDLPADRTWLDVQVQVRDGRSGPGGAIVEAVGAYQDDRRWAQAMHDTTRPVPWLADEAVLSATGGRCRIGARTANVTIQVDLQTLSPSRTWWTRLTAQMVMSHTLAQVTPR